MARAQKTVRISIDGDAKGLQRATRDGERSLDRLNRSGGKALAGLAKGAGLAGLALGGLAAIGLTKAVQAAMEAEKSAARLDAQLKAIGKTSPAVRKQIDDTVSSLSKMSGFDDEALQDAFTRIVRSTGNVKTALGPQGLQLAMDIARAKQIDVAKAAEIVAKAQDGQFMGLKRLGVEVKKGATAQDALAAATKAVGGQADAYAKTTAGAMDRASTAWENVGEKVGSKVAPLVANALNGLATLMDEWGPKIGRVMDDLQPHFREAWRVAKEAARATLDWYNENVRPTLLAIQKFYDEHRAEIAKTMDALKVSVVGSLTQMRELSRGILAAMRGDWDVSFSSIKEIVKTTVRANLAELNAVRNLYENAAAALGRAIWRGFSDALSSLKKNMRGWISDGLSAIPGFGQEAFNKGAALAKSLLAGFGSGLGDIGGWLKGRFSSGVDALVGWIGGKIKDAANSIIRRVNSALDTDIHVPGLDPPGPGSLPGFTIPIPNPNIPTLAARGGTVPGPRGAGDVVPALLTPREVVLTEIQQAMVGIGRIRGALAATGGRLLGFARGGVVPDPAPEAQAAQRAARMRRYVGSALSFALAQVGEPYSTRGRNGPDSWDCSGFATRVASMIPGFRGRLGGTTMTEYPSSTPARGNEPVVYGFRGNPFSNSGPRPAHMGIGILDPATGQRQWIDAGSGGVERGDTRWDSLRVPAGLQGLAALVVGANPGQGPARPGPGGGVGRLRPGKPPGTRFGPELPPPPDFTEPAPDPGAGGDTTTPDVPEAPAAPPVYDPATDFQAQIDQANRERDNARRMAGLSEAALRVFFGSADLLNGANGLGAGITIQSLFPPPLAWLRDAAASAGAGFAMQGGPTVSRVQLG